MSKSFNSSINDMIAESYEDDPIMLEMKQKLANIASKYPVMGEDIKPNDDYQQSFDNSNDQYEVLDAFDADQQFQQSRISQQSDNQIYDTNSFTNKQKTNKKTGFNIDEKEREEILLKRFEKKLKQEKAKLPQIRGGTKQPYRQDRSDADEQIKNIIRKHDKKIEEMQRRNEEIYVKEAINKIKPKKVEQLLTYKDEFKGKGWVDIRTKTGAGDKSSNKPINNQKSAQNVAKKLEKKINQTSNPVSKKSDISSSLASSSKRPSFIVRAGVGVQSEKEKSEISAQRSIKQKAAAELKKAPADGEMKRLQKQKELEKIKEQKEREKKLAQQAKNFVKEGQDLNSKEDRAFKAMQEEASGKPSAKELRQEQLKQKEIQRLEERNKLDEEEIKRLKVELRQNKEKFKQLEVMLQKVTRERQLIDQQVKKKEKDDNVICLGEGQYTSFGLVPKGDVSLASTAIEEGNILDEDEDGDDIQEKKELNQDELNDLSKLSPVEKLVVKLEEDGKNLQDVYFMLDADGDGILTMQEIRDTLPQLEIEDLDQNDIEEIIKILDENSDGTVDNTEFVMALQGKLEQQKQFKAIMGNIKANPQELELRTMDMKIRKKYVIQNYKKELKVTEQKKKEYNKVLEQLKIEEENFQKRERMKKKPDFVQLSKDLKKLKEIRQSKEDDKDKIVIMQKERISEINDNIQDLTQDLIEKSETVLKGKKMLNDLVDEYQKLALKEIAYDKIVDKIKAEQILRDQEKKVQMEKRKLLQQQKNKNVKQNKKQIFSVNETQNAVLLVQKIIRGWKARSIAKKHKLKLKGCVNLIGKNYTWKRRTKAMADTKDQLVNAFQNMQKQGVAGIRQYYYRMEDQAYHQKTGKHLYIKEIKSGMDILNKKKMQEIQQINAQQPLQSDSEDEEENKQQESDDDLIQDQYQKTQMAMNAFEGKNTKKKVKKEKKNDEEDDDEVEIPDFDEQDLDVQLQQLAAIVTLQKYYRIKWNRQVKEDQTFVIPSKIDTKCLICMENKVTKICKQCKEDINMYCTSCYEDEHKSYKRKNHKYFDLKVQIDKEEDFTTQASKIRKMCLFVFQKLGKREIENLGQSLENRDERNLQFLDQHAFSNALQDSISSKKKDEKQIKEYIWAIAEAHRLNDQVVKEQLKEKKQFKMYDAKLKYYKYTEVMQDILLEEDEANRLQEEEEQQQILQQQEQI